MKKSPHPASELQRVELLHSLNLLDSPADERFDSITRFVCRLLSADYAAVSLIDVDRQWFLSTCGLNIKSTSRDVSFCAHTIRSGAPMIIRDTLRDKRFRDNPLVTDGPMFRAYLGCPMTISGLVIGTLCVLYRHPQEFSKENVVDVKELVRIIEDLIACRRA